MAPKSQNISQFLKMDETAPANNLELTEDPPTSCPQDAEEVSRPIDIHIQKLIRDATNVDNISQSGLSWMPWL